MANWVYKNDKVSNEAALMKIVYDKYLDKQFNKSCPLLGLIKKDNKRYKSFKGLKMTSAVQLSVGGGRTSGRLGTTNPGKSAQMTLETKKLYGRVFVDKESMLASRESIEAFAKFTKEPIDRGTDGMHLNIERQIIRNDMNGTGKLFDLQTAASGAKRVTGTGSNTDPYKIPLAPDSIPECVEEGDTVEIKNASGQSVTGVHTVVDIDDEFLYVTGGVLGSLDDNGARRASVYLEHSQNQELSGLAGVLTATSGRYKDIPISRRWRATQINAGGNKIATSHLDRAILSIVRKSSKAPNAIFMPYEQYIIFLGLLEDKKQYNVPARGKMYKGTISFSAIQYMGPEGPIPVFLNRFIDKDKVYVLNTDHICLYSRGPATWSDEIEGKVFTQLENEDAYQARCTFYASFFANPYFQGIITGLNKSVS